RAAPDAAFAADVDGRLAGSVFAATWGTLGFFGPLSVRPDLWGSRRRAALAGAGDRPLRRRPRDARRALHVRAEREARRAVREARLPPAVLDGGDGETPPRRSRRARGG